MNDYRVPTEDIAFVLFDVLQAPRQLAELPALADADEALMRQLLDEMGRFVDGDRYIVPAAATGVWAGKTNQIAVRVASTWEYYTPKVGWLCFVEDEAVLTVYKTTGWSAGIAI